MGGDSPKQYAKIAPREFAILEELRLPGSWHEQKSLEPITWDQLKDDADNERGLFNILALYVDDKLKNRETKSLKEYLDAEESRQFEAGLDLATIVFETAVIAPVATLLGVPTIAVGFVLVGIRYGYRMATDTNRERVGDRSS